MTEVRNSVFRFVSDVWRVSGLTVSKIKKEKKHTTKKRISDIKQTL